MTAATLCLCVVAGIPTGAQPSTPAPTRVAPNLRAFFRVPAYPVFRGLPGRASATVGVTVRLTDPAALRRLLALEGADLRLMRLGGRLNRLGAIVAARVTARGVDLLAAEPAVDRVELDLVARADAPLDYTAAEIDAVAAWATRTTDDIPLTGTGVVIADLDSGVDPLHPMFFRADGGYFAWIDVDGDGAFVAGQDAVDLDRDGQPGAFEVLRFFDAVAYSLRGTDPILGSDNGVFDVGRDYLYADQNFNGQRDYGPAQGFDDSDPGFGEPIFVVDDVDGNGRLDLGERLVMLGSSKIRAINDGTRTYARGQNLATYPHYVDALHGTGVSGILVGGQRGFSRLVGIAPGADLLVGDYAAAGGNALGSLFIWAVQQGADVVLHEYAPWAGVHLDGSSNEEALMDQAAQDGVAQVTPAGNLGGSEKHAIVALPARSATVIPIVVPDHPDPGVRDYNFVQLSVHWRAPSRGFTFRLTTPSAEVVDLGTTGGDFGLADGTTGVTGMRDDSSRGTARFDVWIYGWTGAVALPIEAGTWSLEVSDASTGSPTDPEVELIQYVQDNLSRWGRGVRLPRGTTERHLITNPATADSAIGVAAYTGHDDGPFRYGPEQSGELRRYSCRGTRLDGQSVLDIAAPDNPLTALNRDGEASGHGVLGIFGGTSGAGPHVAGAAALIKQLDPARDGLVVRQAIRDGALVDADVSGDASHARQDLWGAGKLRLYAALYGQTPAPNTAPTIEAAQLLVTAGEPLAFSPVVGDAEDARGDLALWADLDYDGAFEQGPIPGDQPLSVALGALGEHYLKVRVVDTGGLTAEALVQVTVVDTPTCDGAPCPPPDPPKTGCSCRAAGAGDPGTGVAFGLVLLLLVWRRRRRRSLT